MTLPRELTEPEVKLVCQGLYEVIKDIEEALRNKFNNQLEKRERINLSDYDELLERIKLAEKLYKTIGSCVVELKIPPGELVKQEDGSFRRQE